METTTSALKKMLPQFASGEKCTHIFNRGYIVRLDVVTFAREISCPMCGCTEGFRIPDGENVVWSCAQEQCLNVNARVSDEKVVFAPPKKTMALCGVPQDFESATFSGIDKTSEIIQSLDEYCKTFRGFLLLAGPSGRGKTYASCAVLKRYLQKSDNALFMNVSDLYFQWKDLHSGGRSELNLVETCTMCDLFVIDDLGTRTPSDSFLDFIYLIVNKRLNKPHMGTVISTNMDSEQMSQALGSHIVSRIASGVVVKFPRELPDKRIKKF